MRSLLHHNKETDTYEMDELVLVILVSILAGSIGFAFGILSAYLLILMT